MNPITGKLKDLSGSRFGRLTVISRAGTNPYGNATWNCECDCGKKTVVAGGALLKTKSCGCLRSDATKEAKTIHGMSYTGTYRSWCSMKSRCRNPNFPDYFRYGGRGISFPDKWETFEGFLEDMGLRPKGTSIERKNNLESYSKENCVWDTPKSQARNRRSSRVITIEGVTMTLAEWSEKSGIKAITIHERIKRGYDPKRAVFSKLDPRGQRK